MKKLLLVLGALMLVCAPAMAQGMGAEPTPKDPAKEEPKKDEPKDVPKDAPKEDAAKADAFKAYRTKGNTWTVKVTTTIPGVDPSVTYMKTEVTEVSDKAAVIKISMLDSSQAETYSSTKEILFTTPKAPEPEGEKPEAEAPKTTEEKIKVEAGEFECIKMVTDSGGVKSTIWSHKQFPSVSVKVEVKGEGYTSTTELTALSIK